VPARVRVSGTLRAPERRTLKHGGLCVTATLTSTDGVRTQFWHIAAINETVQAELMGLSNGESVAVEGVLKAGLHNRNGEIELCFGVIAERALCLQPTGKKRTSDEQADADRLNTTSSAPRMIRAGTSIGVNGLFRCGLETRRQL
jgi:hypothetical protein